MTTLKLTLVQTHLAWEDPQANIAHFAQRLDDIGDTDIIILPEMFSTGFSMNSSALAEPMDGQAVSFLKAMSIEHDTWVCASVITVDGGNYYNRFVAAGPDGNLIKYDKRHLFRMSTENENYAQGHDRNTFEVEGVRVFPQVCYDLRFPVFSRNNLDFALMIYVANWPAARRDHWNVLLRARAIENQCYVVGLNRIGIDGNDVAYSGDSAVIDFNGKTLLALEDKDTVATATIELGALANYRQQFPAWKDADHFDLDA